MSAPTAAAAVPQRTIMFTKTEAEYSMRSIRFLLLTITTMFIVIGVMMMVLGISVYSHFHSFTYFYETIMSSRFATPSVMCVFLGLTILVVSLFGFFGSLKQSTCMVNMYAMILMKILIIKIIVIILAFTTSQATLMSYINIPISQYPVDLEIQSEIQALQRGLSCCGSDSILDYMGMEFPENHTTLAVTVVDVTGDHITLMVPSSCCARDTADSCAVIGCKQVISDIVVLNSRLLGILGISVMFILLLGIIFAMLLARSIRKLKSEKAMMAWKIREQLILARMEQDKKLDNTLYISPPDSSVA